jgi:hypothetical protein
LRKVVELPSSRRGGGEEEVVVPSTAGIRPATIGMNDNTRNESEVCKILAMLLLLLLPRIVCVLS